MLNMRERKAVPASKCDYILRMHLKSIEAISSYMKSGCKKDGPSNSVNMMVALITLRNTLNEIIEEYSAK